MVRGKPRLLLYITADANPRRNAFAATLAWAAPQAGWHAEVYYDAYRLGDHYGGGDPQQWPHGVLTGGTLVGAHHHERLYLLLHRFDVLAVTDGPVAFDAALHQLDVPRVAIDSLEDGYAQVFAALGLDIPTHAVLVDAAPTEALRGLDAYAYPEIVGRQALGLEVSAVTPEQVGWLADHGVHTAHAQWLGTPGRHAQEALAAGGITFASSDALQPHETFQSATQRMARRWLDRMSGGWVLADPLTVSAWLVEAVRERRLAIYGKPQRDVIEGLQSELAASDAPILGRQYEDADFFDLSRLGAAFQLIDPARPPFPVLRSAGYDWAHVPAPQADPSEPDDLQLAEWARQGRVLTSVVFWSGMIRELENLYRIVDLVALTRLRAGVALTIAALEYQPESPVELLRVPLDAGGVAPNLEILWASCGLGAAIESHMPVERLREHLAATRRRMDDLRIPDAVRPQGWWPVMDPDMLPLPKPSLPVAPQGVRRWPFVQLRYTSASHQATAPAEPTEPTEPTEIDATSVVPNQRSRRQRMAAWARGHGLDAMLAPYRPYERYIPGEVRHDILEAVRAVGLRYALSKSGFGRTPRVLTLADDFIAINYTVGHWDGWTPFETINHLNDLRIAERELLASGKPGWLLGTLDSCLWAFTGPVWQRGAELFKIATFLANGGASERLINVTPRTIARYARHVAALNPRHE